MMERIWAPWRMEYILGPKDSECIFCFEPCQDTKRQVLRRENHALVLLNKYPYTNGHLLVVPKRHVDRTYLLPADESQALHELLEKSVATIEKVLSPDGMNVGMNLGTVAGAGIKDHAHYHIVPRWNGDTNFMPVLGSVRMINQHLQETYEQLLPSFLW
jgi:ATP adenylyltransferase